MSNIGKIDGVRLKVVDDEITVNVATDAQLETGTPEELDKLGINARQFVEERETVSQAFANKSNLDMDNISNVGKSNISGLGFPSASFEVVPITNSYTIANIYDATNNGTFSLATSTASRVSIRIQDLTSGMNIFFSDTNTYFGVYGICFDVVKGHKYSIQCYNEQNLAWTGRFYYAQGELD